MKIIIYGAPGTGKTRRSKELLSLYKGDRIKDGWDGSSPLQDGDIALTNLYPPFLSEPDARVVNVMDAKLALTK